MPVVDKLPALLREDLESAFEDDMDSVFDITNLRHSLGQQKRETEIELKQVLHLCCTPHPYRNRTVQFGIFFQFVLVNDAVFCRYKGLKENSDRFMSSLICIRSC